MSVKGKLSTRLEFHNWEVALEQRGVLAHRQESIAITIRWYLKWLPLPQNFSVATLALLISNRRP